MLQWGRIHADAEGDGTICSECKGVGSFNGAASMRMRREFTLRLTETFAKSGFNGAASMRMRRVRLTTNPDATSWVKLQWGRIHADAEGHLVPPNLGRVDVLQWGRIHADAEGAGRILCTVRIIGASMGPHPCGCGGEKLIQGMKDPESRFNGAASMRMRRGNSRSPQPSALWRFNGAASMRMRRVCRRATAHSGPHRGFNGAASMRMRRAGRKAGWYIAELASMGPHPCGCGGHDSCPQNVPSLLASMGPHPCGCGGTTRSGSTKPAMVGFNGAASMRMRRG